MPDRVGAQGEIVDRGIQRDAPGLGQLGLRQTAIIKGDQAAVEQTIDIPVGSVIKRQDRIQAREFADQAFGVTAPGNGFRLQGLHIDRLLAQEQNAYRHQSENDDQ